MKLKRKNGFTLAEMLIAVMLLGFVSLMAGVMTSAVLDTTVTMQEVAQAEILGNEALENIQNELRFGTNVTLKEGNVTYGRNMTQSGGNTTYRDSCTFALENGMIVITFPDPDDETKTKSEPLFGGTTYGKNLTISELKFAISKDSEGEEDKTVLTFSVTVSFRNKTIWNGSASVKPLNGISET